jgi:hypothetical protein
MDTRHYVVHLDTGGRTVSSCSPVHLKILHNKRITGAWRGTGKCPIKIVENRTADPMKILAPFCGRECSTGQGEIATDRWGDYDDGNGSHFAATGEFWLSYLEL